MNKKHLEEKELKKRISITMEPEIIDELDQVSRERGLSRSALLRLAWQSFSGRGSLEDSAIAVASKK